MHSPPDTSRELRVTFSHARCLIPEECVAGPRRVRPGCPLTFRVICFPPGRGANMKKHILNLIAIVALVALVGCKKDEKAEKSTLSEPAAPRPAAGASPAGVSGTAPFAGGRRTSFQEVTSQLDPGGSLFLYLATDQWLAGLSTNIAQVQQILSSMPGPSSREEVARVFEVLTRLVKTSGVEDVTGVGLSAAPVAPGLYRNKFI